MIHINRSKVAPPQRLLNAAEAEASEAKDFYSDPQVIRYNKPFPFTAHHTEGVKETLINLFHGKCAFCETQLDQYKGISWEIERFRPTNMAVNHDGTISKPGYWWLAVEWSNLYPICAQCAATKANRFPVFGSRAEFCELGSLEQTITTQGPVHFLSLYGDGRIVVAANKDGDLWITDLESGFSHKTRLLEDGSLSQLTVAPRGSTIFVATVDGTLLTYEIAPTLELGREQRITRVTEPIHDIATSQDGRFLAVAAGSQIRLWEKDSAQQIDTQEIETTSINRLAISRDGQTILFGTSDGRLGRYDRENGNIDYSTAADTSITGIAVDADERNYFSLSADGSIHAWDYSSGEKNFHLRSPSAAQKLMISAAGRFCITLGSEGITLFDIYKRSQLLSLNKKTGQFNDIAISPDGRSILAAGDDATIKVWALDTIAAERALIIDPCMDEPTNYLVFGEDGLVASVPPKSPALLVQDGDRFSYYDRGQLTIDAFGLNRIELVRARRSAAEQLRQEIANVLAMTGPQAFGTSEEERLLMEQLMSSSHPFAALRRQLIPELIQELTTPAAKSVAPETHEEILEQEQDTRSISFQVPFESEAIDFDLPFTPAAYEQKINKYAVDRSIFKSAFENLESTTSARKVVDIEEGQSDLVGRSALISRVEIKNFRALEDLSFDFGGGIEGRVGWKVLLGENGVGKSSVLQAVALTVMGRRRLRELADTGEASLPGDSGFKPAPDLRMENILRRGAQEGSVKVYFSTDTQPIELRLTKDGPDLDSAEPALRTYLLGFGSARWLPRAGARAPEDDQYVRVRNLFNPFVPLTDAIPWLVKLKRSRKIKKYQAVERVLARLLQLDLETRFPLRRVNESGEDVIYVQRPGAPVRRSDRLDQLSDGYQTILAIAVAILDMVGEEWDMELELAEGLVLLDEIGSHLHPRWKLRIVESLRTAFPRMQFLSATHEPLCLRGLYDNEILVLVRDDDQQLVVKDNIPSPNAYTVDQLLRSPLFGLLTTFDPDTERHFERYYEILSKPAGARSEKEQEDLEIVRRKIGNQGILGEMTRRQIASTVMDEKMQETQGDGPAEDLDPENLSDETKSEIADMWAEIFSE